MSGNGLAALAVKGLPGTLPNIMGWGLTIPLLQDNPSSFWIDVGKRHPIYILLP